MPFQSGKQRRYLWANEPEIARDWTNRYGAANGGIMDIASDGNLIDRFKNYKKNKQVTVPTSFQARSHSTPVNLAYITDDEARILQTLKPDVPHDGPMHIPNYDDYDPDRGYRSGTTMSAAETGAKNERSRADYRAAGMSPQEVQDIRSSAINAGAGQTVNPGWFGPRYNSTVGVADIAAAKAYRNNPNNRFAKQAYRNTRGSPFGIGNLFRGALSIFGGLPGKALSMFSHLNPGKLRGWNEEEGRYNTQDEYEQARTNRRNTKRMDYLSDRKSKGLGYGKKAYADLLGQGYSDSFQDAINADYASGMNVNDGPFSRSHLQSLTNKLSAQNYNFASTPFNPSQGGIMSTPQGMDFAGARRAMTQPGLDKFRPMTDQQVQKYGQLSTQNINRGVYDPYGIRTPSGAFSYDMNYNNNVPADPYADIEGQRAEVSRSQYNQLKAMGQVGNTAGDPDEIKGLVPEGTFDSIQPSEWDEIFQGKKFKDITQIT